MSRILRRGLSSLIPPKIASPANIGAAPNAKRIDGIVKFYKALPRGEQEAPEGAMTPFLWYQQKYIETDSSKPILHLIGFFLIVGYSFDYYFHLRHEKH